MKFIEKMKQIERVDGLIRRKATGSPKELANRIGVSERTVYDCIETMKLMNAPIFYCRNCCSYCYEKKVRFSFGFKDLGLNENSIIGGNNSFNLMNIFNCLNV